MTFPFALRALAIAGALSASLSAHAQAWPIVDAGDVRIEPSLGSFSIVGTDVFTNGPLYYSSVIQNGLSFKPGTSTSSIASYDNYRASGTMLVDVSAGFTPETGFHITGYQVTLTGTYTASGTGRAKVWLGLSGSGESSSNPVLEWYQQGAGQQAFTWNHLYAAGSALPKLAFQASTEAYYGSFCSPDFPCTYYSGQASVNLSEIKLQAVVARDVISSVPEADGAWMAAVGMGMLTVGAVSARKRRQA